MLHTFKLVSDVIFKIARINQIFVVICDFVFFLFLFFFHFDFDLISVAILIKTNLKQSNKGKNCEQEKVNHLMFKTYLQFKTEPNIYCYLFEIYC